MLISLLIAVIVIGLLFYLISMLPIPQPWANIAKVILIVICIIWLLGYSGVLGGGPYWGGNHLSHCP
jgi:hypothetical protein